MHDRFEKEVQKKMEELNLSPSAPVWEKIELEIRPEKKKRRALIWFFFGLLLLGGGLLTRHFTGGDDSSISSHSPIPVETKKEKARPFPETSSSPLNTTEIPIGKEDLTTIQIQQTDKIVNKDLPEVIQPQPNKINANFKSKESVRVPQNSNRQPQEKPVSKPTEVITSNNEVTEQKAMQMPTDKEQPPAVITSDSSIVTREASETKDSATREPEKKDELPKLSSDSALKTKVAASRKWKKQITAGAGRSSYADNAITWVMPSNGNFQSPSTGSGGALISYRPSETTPGAAFMVGFSLSRKLSNHIELAFGLQYAFYTTKTKVGNSRQSNTTIRYSYYDINVSQYYPNAGSNDFVNRFHVVELPVTISYQPSLQLPLYISLGAAYGRLVSTNALTFSNTANVYYPNNDNYVRNMLPVSSSVQVALFSKKKISLRVGPSVQYNLLKLRKENIGGKPHLFFAGIKTAVNF